MKNCVMQSKPLTRLDTHYLLTNIKGVMIYLLVVFHFISPVVNTTQLSYADSLSFGGTLVLTLVVMVILGAVPMFVMITGYGSKDADSCRETAFGLYFVPYVILMLLMAVEYAVFSGTLYINLSEPMMQLWFLMAMYIWMLILKDVSSIRFAIPITIVVSIVAGMVANSKHFMFTTGLGSFFSLSYVVTLLPFLLIGKRVTQDTLSKIRNARLTRILAAVLTVAAITVAVACLIYFNDSFKLFDLAVLKGSAGYLTYFGNLGTYSKVNISGAAFRGVFMVFAIALGVIAIRFMPKKKIPFLTRIGNASLTVFSLHVFIIIPVTKFLKLDVLPMFLIALPASAFICWLLSLNKVNRTYMSLMFRIADAIKKKPKKAES